MLVPTATCYIVPKVITFLSTPTSEENQNQLLKTIQLNLSSIQQSIASKTGPKAWAGGVIW